MILVTGATGNTGRAVVQALSERGVAVRAMVRKPEQVGGFGTGVDVVVADMTQPASLPAAVRGARQMLLISPLDASMEELQSRMAQAARAGGVQRIVKISTEIADPASDALIGQWHGKAERAVESTGLDFCHLRPCNFMQNLHAFDRDIRAHHAFSAPLGDARISLVDVADLAAVAVAVLLDPPATRDPIVVTGATSPTYHHYAALLTAQLGYPVRYEATTPDEALRRFLAEGMPRWKAHELIRMYAHLQDPAHTRPTDAVLRYTGRPPRAFEDFVQTHARRLADPGAGHG